jgi:hypothetical protein
VTLGDPVWSDIIPPAPTVFTSAPLDHGLLITWNAVSTPAGGTPVDRYHVSVGGYSGDFGPGICSGGTCTFDTTSIGWPLDNGVAVSYTVSPRNAAYTALSVWNTSDPRSDVPAGPPIATGTPVATAVSDTAVDFDWSAVFSDNGRPITGYAPIAYTGAVPSCPSSPTTTGTSTQFTGLSPNGTYSLIVFAFNSQGCTASSPVVAHTPPGVITSLSFGLVQNGSNWDIAITGGSMGGDPLTGSYSIYYQLSGDNTTGGLRGPVALGDPLTADGSQYGQHVVVEALACRTYDSSPVCQPALSGAFATGYVPVNPSLPGGEQPVFTSTGLLSGDFDWLGWPSGPGYESIQYTCDGQGGYITADTSQPGHCSATGLLVMHLTIRVVANGGQTYDITYASN